METVALFVMGIRAVAVHVIASHGGVEIASNISVYGNFECRRQAIVVEALILASEETLG